MGVPAEVKTMKPTPRLAVLTVALATLTLSGALSFKATGKCKV